jgi:hypothetical protein
MIRRRGEVALFPSRLGYNMRMTSTLRAICPIYGLGWVTSDLQIRADTVLRFIDLINNESDEITSTGLHAASYKCVLEISQKYDPKDYSIDAWLNIQEIVFKIESALRIYHEGRIGVAAIIYFESDQRQSARILDGFIPNGQEDYQIDKAKLKSLPEFFADFEKAFNEKPVALQYFSRSQQRYANNDKSIDLCTALESLFVPNNSRGAKKVFLTQGVNILGFSIAETQMIGDLYDYRNTIIHGDHRERTAIFSKKKGN